MENNEIIQKCGPKFWQNSNFSELLLWKSLGKGTQKFEFCQTFVRPHCSPFDVTLVIVTEVLYSLVSVAKRGYP